MTPGMTTCKIAHTIIAVAGMREEAAQLAQPVQRIIAVDHPRGIGQGDAGQVPRLIVAPLQVAVLHFPAELAAEPGCSVTITLFPIEDGFACVAYSSRISCSV